MLLNAGLSLVEANLIEVQPVGFEMPESANILLFTSQNAVESVMRHPDSHLLKSKKAVCVGIKTKALLEANDFEVVACEDYAEQLAEVIINSYCDKSFSFFAGNLRRDTLPEALSSAGINFTETKVYETQLKPQKITSKPDGILFFSPSGIESYLAENKITNETCFCIGTTTANALAGITDNIIIANRPTVENTIIQCINYFKIRQT